MDFNDVKNESESETNKALHASFKVGLQISQGRQGFSITFENGWTVSIQFGGTNYCSLKNLDYESLSEISKFPSHQSEDAEIAVFNDKGEWATHRMYAELGDDVKGYVGPNEIADLLYSVANGAGRLIMGNYK